MLLFVSSFRKPLGIPTVQRYSVASDRSWAENPFQPYGNLILVGHDSGPTLQKSVERLRLVSFP
jgi:hypothetical protein